MRQAVLKSLYDLHSWVGLVLGLILYIVCFSGVVALFDAELGPWDRGDVRAYGGPAPAGLDRAVAHVVGGIADEGRGVNFTVRLPTPYRQTVAVDHRGADGPVTEQFDPMTGEPVPSRGSVSTTILTRLHTDLLLPQPWGRYLVGGLGIVMLLSVISGVILHRKIIRDAFTLRLDRSLRLKWTDLHKAVGLWGLPFHFTMALTGAILGFVGLILMYTAVVAFKGDLGSAAAEMMAPGVIATGEAAPMMPVSALIEMAGEALPGIVPEVVMVRAYGDSGAVAEVMGNVPGSLVYYPSVSLEAATGAVLGVTDWSAGGIGKRVYAMVTPLHYASYGGFALKVLYALLGAGSCFLVVSGLSIWHARPHGRATMQHLTTGVVYGLPLAIAGLLVAGRVAAPAFAADERGMTLLFLLFCCPGVAWPWLRGAARAASEMLLGTGLLLAAFPALTIVGGGAESYQVWGVAGAPVATADIAGFLLGLGALAWGMAEGRRLRRRHDRGADFQD